MIGALILASAVGLGVLAIYVGLTSTGYASVYIGPLLHFDSYNSVLGGSRTPNELFNAIGWGLWLVGIVHAYLSVAQYNRALFR